MAVSQDKGLDMFTAYLKQQIAAAAEEAHTALVEDTGRPPSPPQLLLAGHNGSCLRYGPPLHKNVHGLWR